MKNLTAMFAISFAIFQVGCGNDTPTFSVLPEENTFIQNSGGEQAFAKIDLLWVIDNSGSMQTSQDNIAANFQTFIDKFLVNKYDYRIAVTTTDAYKGYYYPSSEDDYAQFKEGHYDSSTRSYVHTNVRVITQDTPDPVAVFLDNVTQGTRGSGLERAFQSMEVALESSFNTGFVRPDSFFAVIIVSDEDDFSHPENNWGPAYGGSLDSYYNDPDLISVDHYVNYLETLTQSSGLTKRFSVSAMTILDNTCLSELGGSGAGRMVGQRYIELVEATGGIQGNLCGNFADDLQLISNEILKSATEYYLDRTPKPETIIVTINNDIVPNASENSGPTVGGWTYDGAKNSITFSGDYLPAQGAVINVVFDTLTLEE